MLPTFASCQQEKPFPDDAVDKVYEYLPEWQAGYLDIHQISTGRGNAAYLIFPDGTTMLLDAGDLGVHSGTQEIMKAVPNDSKRPAEWIAQYIKHFSLPLKNNGALDYALLTHFDTDHIGQNGKLAIEKVGLDYKLTGITHVGNLLNISTLIDRGYPTYDYPTAAKVSGAHISNYKLYVAARDREGKKNEGFVIGSNSQIKLLKDPGSYPTFEVRNIVGNGKIWTGSGTTAKELVPVPEMLLGLFTSISDNKYVVIAMLNVIMIIVGMLMDDSSGIVLCAPLLLPVAQGVGFSPIHFAAILGVNLGMGLVTPPMAGNLYFASQVCDAPVGEMLKPCLQLIAFGWLPTLILTTVIPEISLFLPNLILG